MFTLHVYYLTSTSGICVKPLAVFTRAHGISTFVSVTQLDILSKISGQFPVVLVVTLTGVLTGVLSQNIFLSLTKCFSYLNLIRISAHKI